MNLHNEIMNLQIKQSDGQRNRDMGDSGELCYKIGHRDARHAAAELSLKYEGFMYALIDALENRHADDLVDKLKEKYGL